MWRFEYWYLRITAWMFYGLTNLCAWIIKVTSPKLNTYDIWDICSMKCDCWPGDQSWSRRCDNCATWKNLSNAERYQIEQEKDAYAHHCITGD
jgi:hypothetical protein